jgi:hypothetical protein
LYERDLQKQVSTVTCDLEDFTFLYHFRITPTIVYSSFHPTSSITYRYKAELKFSETVTQPKVGKKRKEIPEFDALEKAEKKRVKLHQKFKTANVTMINAELQLESNPKNSRNILQIDPIGNETTSNNASQTNISQNAISTNPSNDGNQAKFCEVQVKDPELLKFNFNKKATRYKVVTSGTKGSEILDPSKQNLKKLVATPKKKRKENISTQLENELGIHTRTRSKKMESALQPMDWEFTHVSPPIMNCGGVTLGSK